MTVAIVVILFCGIFGTVAAFIVPRIIAARAEAAKWSPLFIVPGAKVYSTDSAEVQQVDLALAKALDSLQEFGPWPTSKKEALAALRIIVAPTGTWKDSAGQTVGGQAYYTIIQVDQGLTSLCHEVAHVLEFAIDGAVDASHSRWEARGIHAADEDYRLKLLGA